MKGQRRIPRGGAARRGGHLERPPTQATTGTRVGHPVRNVPLHVIRRRRAHRKMRRATRKAQRRG